MQTEEKLHYPWTSSACSKAAKNWARRERDRRYRERLRQDPERYQRMLEQTRLRQKRRTERMRQQRMVQSGQLATIMGEEFIISVNKEDGSPPPGHG
ncbi:hypothetical protein ACOMHN_022984 [Nucella lapillus]